MADIFAFDDIETSTTRDKLDDLSLSDPPVVIKPFAVRETALPESDDENDDGGDTVGDLSGAANGGVKGIAINNPNSGSNSGDSHNLSSSLRLGTSYEVGIENQYISSFANDGTSSLVPPKKMTPDDFEPLKVLGEGTYGKVFLVRQKSTGRLFAQKQLKKASMIVEKKKIERTKTERSILESVRHPYIVRLFYALQDKEKLYLILEYAQGGELFSHLAKQRMFSEDTAAYYTAQMVLALYHLQANVGVVYRDLKPENCLLDQEGHLVLTDFGLSKVANDERCNTFLGTAEYMAPEILEGKDYDYAVDWWSLGAVLFDILTGQPPFPGNNFQKIIQKIKKNSIKFPYYLSEDAKDLLRRLLRRDTRRRLGYKDIDTIKKHRFFRKIDWKKLEERSPELQPPIVPIVTDPVMAENFSTSFTDRPLTPEDINSIPIPPNEKETQIFQGFSFTASNSFIELAASSMANMDQH